MEQEIRETYLKSFPESQQGHYSGYSLALLFLPHLLIDCQYLLYDEHIKDIEMKFDLKKNRNEWMAIFNKRSKEFYKSFNDDQTAYILDNMDRFGDYIRHELSLLQIQIQNEIMHYPLEIRKKCSVLLACSVLAQYAKITYESVYKTRFNSIRKMNDHIVYLYQHLSCPYKQTGEIIDLNTKKNVTDIADLIAKKVLLFKFE